MCIFSAASTASRSTLWRRCDRRSDENSSILNLIYTTVARPKRFYTPLSARPHATRPLQNTCDSTHTGVQPQRLQVRRPGPRQALNSLSMFHVSLSRFSRTTSGSQGARGGHAINHATHPPRSPKPPSRHTHTKVHCTGIDTHTNRLLYTRTFTTILTAARERRAPFPPPPPA